MKSGILIAENRRRPLPNGGRIDFDENGRVIILARDYRLIASPSKPRKTFKPKYPGLEGNVAADLILRARVYSDTRVAWVLWRHKRTGEYLGMRHVPCVAGKAYYTRRSRKK